MIDIIDDSWKPFFFNYHGKELFRWIESLEKDSFYPEKDSIFSVFETALHDIKVVILGQDPYPRKGHAIGLAFGVPSSISKPPSLRNIEKEVGHEINRTLIPWANQGVFLLNTALTVERNNAGSHIGMWQDFTGKLITYISLENPCVWMLWGKYAQSFTGYIKNFVYEYPKEDEIGKNVVLVAAHPAAESYKSDSGFYGCNHFEKANNALTLNNKQTINW